MSDSLWGDDFIIPETKKIAKKIVKKISEPKDPSQVVTKAVKSKTLSIKDKLNIIRENVLKILGRYRDNTLVIKDRKTLTDYIDKAIANGIVAVDTETNNSLDPITCKLMGPCLYTPGLKQAYVPINHVNPDTLERLDWQLTEEDVAEELARLKPNNTKIVMHNGKFDYAVIKCTTKIILDLYWDTLIGAKVLDENEKANLKQQYIDKIDSTQEKYSIDHLFEDIEYALVDPEIFALYAATDSWMTYKLYEWQKEKFELPGHENLYNLFKTVEMPVIIPISEMELTGVEVDQEYAELLSKKYHKKLDKIDNQISLELAKIQDKIDAWRQTDDANFHPTATKASKDGTFKEQKSKNEQLEDPINLASPTQLAILFYDILKCPPVNKKKPRATGEAELDAIAKKLKTPVCDLLIERRGLVKLLTTYIDVIPELATRWPDGRVRTHFNQYGAATGRMSSSDPINLQNIPSHNKEIRMLFKAKDNHILIGSDFSQQEPRLLSAYSGDENMINAYKAGKDLYATIACGVYKNTYWDNMEHWEDGSPNPEGKKRRGSVKSILLGIMYGRGVASIAEQIGRSVEEAQQIIDDFYKGFPKVKEWTDRTQSDARKTGYVEDLWGRRRRLTDLLLPKYKITDKNNVEGKFNPLLECTNKFSGKDNPNILKYSKLLENIKYRKDYEKIQQDALKEGIEIHDNTGFIAQAERQCVNARIQGGAASMTKVAVIKLYNDQKLKDLGFKLNIAVHDELIGECPKQNADAVAERLCNIMKSAAEDVCDVPFKCDPTLEHCWYFSDFADNVQKEFKSKLKDKSWDEAFSEMVEIHDESTIDQLHELLDQIA